MKGLNKLLKKLTKDYTEIPLLWVMFDYQKYQKSVEGRSQPAWAAWIEIAGARQKLKNIPMAHIGIMTEKKPSKHGTGGLNNEV